MRFDPFRWLWLLISGCFLHCPRLPDPHIRDLVAFLSSSYPAVALVKGPGRFHPLCAFRLVPVLGTCHFRRSVETTPKQRDALKHETYSG